uniref:Acid protease n=1 Tax=Mycena chlorophos TaxID=658473 RepID=A0ABQ0MC33_MYCCL|nr:acid protease [Mycena chlorophos]
MLSHLALLVLAAHNVLAAQAPVSLPLARQFRPPNGRLSDYDKQRGQALRTQQENRRPNSPHTNHPSSRSRTSLPVGFGEPPKNFSLLIDTGSSNTWIASDASYIPMPESVKDAACTQPVTIQYGSGSFTGVEVIAPVTLATELFIHNQSIGTGAPYDIDIEGILGLGPVDLTQGTLILSPDETIPTITDNLFAQHSISEEVVSIFFAPTTMLSVVNGELTFGGVDEAKFTSRVHYAPVTMIQPAGSYWGIEQSISYGGEEIMSQNAGIVDTGTTLLNIPSDAFAIYQRKTGATMDQTTGLLTITEEQFQNLVDLEFNINGKTFYLTPDAQIWPQELNTEIGGQAGSIYLIIADTGVNSGSGLDFINGYVFLERYASVYDTSKNRVGFAHTAWTDSKVNKIAN